MRILLVEDDPSAAKVIELALRAEGFVIDTTDLGEDGLEIGKLYDYDLIILDLITLELITLGSQYYTIYLHMDRKHVDKCF